MDDTMMADNGRAKLVEEIGEVLAAFGGLLQVIGKLTAYPSGEHPDGKGDLYDRLALEIGDAKAAIALVECTHGLNMKIISEQREKKFNTFCRWHEDKDN